MSNSYVGARGHVSPSNSAHEQWLDECRCTMLNSLKAKEIAYKVGILLLFLESILPTQSAIRTQDLGLRYVSHQVGESGKSLKLSEPLFPRAEIQTTTRAFVQHEIVGGESDHVRKCSPTAETT